MKRLGFSLIEFSLSLTLLAACAFIIAQWNSFKVHYQKINVDMSEVLPYINTFSWLVKAKKIQLKANDTWYGTQQKTTKERIFSRGKPEFYACKVIIKQFNDENYRIQFYGYYKKTCLVEFFY